MRESFIFVNTCENIYEIFAKKFVKIFVKESLELFEAVPGNAGVIHRQDCLSKTEHGGQALQTNVYLI